MKSWWFLTPNLRTAESIRNLIKNPPKWTENQIWQPKLDDFRTLLLRDYDEIVRNINELSEWIENNK